MLIVLWNFCQSLPQCHLCISHSSHVHNDLELHDDLWRSRDVEGKQKIKNNSVNHWLFAYMFNTFGRGRLNSVGDRRA